MIAVTFLNNYPMREALKRVGDGDYPGQHLWGYGSQNANESLDWRMPRWSIYDISLLRHAKLRWVRNGIVKLIGDPLQQAHTLIHAPRDGVVYAADQRSAATLGLLKTLGLWRSKLVVVIHHPPANRWERWCLRSADAALYLSPFVGRAIQARLPSIPLITAAPWGPDLESHVYTRPDVPTERTDFVAAGKTNRDYSTLREVAEKEHLSGVIFEEKTVTRYEHGHPTVETRSADYSEILRSMRSAAAVVIPIADPNVMAGLTEVADAIAVNRPIIVSESVAFPYDIDGARGGTTLKDASPTTLGAAIHQAVSGDFAGSGDLSRSYNMDQFSRVLVDTLVRVQE